MNLYDQHDLQGYFNSTKLTPLPDTSSDELLTPPEVSLLVDVDPDTPAPSVGPDPHVFAPTKMSFWPQLVTQQWDKFPAHARIYNATRVTCLPNHLGAKIPVASGLNIPNWELALVGYHDTALLSYLKFGWPVGYTAPQPPASVNRNHPSATRHPADIEVFIQKEIRLGGLLGPFTAPPFTPWTNCAPLMTAPKKDSLARRVILDLSFPVGQGTNAGITKNCLEGKMTNYTLPSIHDLITYITNLGPGAFLWKTDLSRAYRQLRSDPCDTPLLCFKYKGLYFADLCPSFGARLSGAACQRTTSALAYIMRSSGHHILVYLDDFCGAAPDLIKAKKAYTAITDLCAHLGLQLAPEKCTPPSQRLEWLGFLVDTVAMTVTIPAKKLAEILQECKLWLNLKLAPKQEAQSLVGKLMHITKCIPHARKFSTRILSALRDTPDGGMVHVSFHFKQDILWYVNYAALANGIYMYDFPPADVIIECDSSLEGGGGNSETCYYQVIYTAAHKAAYEHINLLEAVNLVTAYRTLVPTDSDGFRILIYTDNLISQGALETGRTRNRVLAACARQLWLESAQHNHTIIIHHKSGRLIPLADALSRPNDDLKKAYVKKTVKERRLKCLKAKLPYPLFSVT